MNLLKSKLRRTTAVLAGAILGLGGVAFLATPASAHHSVVKGSPTCDTETGDWVVKWTVNTFAGSYHGKDAKSFRMDLVDTSPTKLDAPTEENKLVQTAAPDFPFAVGTTLYGIQRVPGSQTSATIGVKAAWDNGFNETDVKSFIVNFEGTCGKEGPKPDAQMASTCAGVTVTLANAADAKKDAEFTVKGSNGFTKTVVVKAGDKPSLVEVPAKDAATITVTEKHSDKPVLTGKYEEPKDCHPAPEDKADRFYEVTCDSLIFTIDNTKGTETVTAKFTPNKGEAKTLTVLGGKTGSVEFKGGKGLEVTPSEADVKYDVIKWDKEEKPKDCTKSPTPAANGEGGGGELALTGAAAGGIAGGAGVLLAIGAVLFFMARRRKVKFTA